MEYLFDILAGVTLLFFFLSGWHRGFTVSVLRITSVVAAYFGALFSAKTFGPALAEAAEWPRIFIMPLTGLITYLLIALLFSILLHLIHLKHRKREKEEEFHLSLPSCISGGIISLTAGFIILIIAFWGYDVLRAGILGKAFPSSEDSRFCTLAHKIVYKTVYSATADQGRSEAQTRTIARLISEPSQATGRLEAVLNNSSIQQMATDPQFSEDLLSGDAERIKNNAAVSALMNDREALDQLQELGVVSGFDNQEQMLQKMTDAGQRMQQKLSDPRIQQYISELQQEGALTAENLPQLLNDHRFLLVLDSLLMN